MNKYTFTHNGFTFERISKEKARGELLPSGTEKTGRTWSLMKPGCEMILIIWFCPSSITTAPQPRRDGMRPFISQCEPLTASQVKHPQRPPWEP